MHDTISRVATLGTGLTEAHVAEVISHACPAEAYKSKRVLLIVPDGTRTAPVGLLFQKLAEIHPRFETPSFSILVQGVWTALLTLSGSYETLFSYVLFAAWIFHAMAVLGVLILRREYPNLRRPYKMWGYPVTPLVFVAVAAWFVANMLLSKPGTSSIGLLIILSGIPAYYGWKWREEKKGRTQALANRPSAV